jgi:hypothetical protein
MYLACLQASTSVGNVCIPIHAGNRQINSTLTNFSFGTVYTRTYKKAQDSSAPASSQSEIPPPLSNTRRSYTKSCLRQHSMNGPGYDGIQIFDHHFCAPQNFLRFRVTLCTFKLYAEVLLVCFEVGNCCSAEMEMMVPL